MCPLSNHIFMTGRMVTGSAKVDKLLKGVIFLSW